MHDSLCLVYVLVCDQVHAFTLVIGGRLLPEVRLVGSFRVIKHSVGSHPVRLRLNTDLFLIWSLRGHRIIALPLLACICLLLYFLRWHVARACDSELLPSTRAGVIRCLTVLLLLSQDPSVD